MRTAEPKIDQRQKAHVYVVMQDEEEEYYNVYTNTVHQTTVAKVKGVYFDQSRAIEHATKLDSWYIETSVKDSARGIPGMRYPAGTSFFYKK